MSTARNIVKNTIFLSGQQIIMQIVALFVIGYIASIIGVEDYGIFVFSLSFPAIFGLISNLGTRTYATKEIASNRNNAKQIFSDILPLRIYLAFIATISSLIIVNILPYSEKEILLVEIAIFSQLCTWIYINTFIVYEAFERMAYPVTIDLVIRIFVLIGSVISVKLGYGVVGLASFYAIGNFIEIFAAYFFLHRRFFKPTYNLFPIRTKYNIELLKVSFPFCILGIFNVLISESDKIMLSLIQGPAAVGLYGVAFTIYSRLAGLVDALSTAFFPVIIRLRKELDLSVFRSKITDALQILVVIMAPIAFGVFLVSDNIVTIVFKSEEFFPAGFTLRLIIMSLPFGALSFVFGFSLIGEGRQVLLVKLNAIILLLNITINILLIPLYSYNGAAIATMICLVVKSLILMKMCFSIVEWKRFLRTIVIVISICFVMCIIVNYFLTYNLLISILLGTWFYAIGIFLLKPFDIKKVYQIIRKK